MILDGAGCGIQSDYKKYHPHRSNTLLSVYKNNPELHLPKLESLGFNKIIFNKNSDRYYAGKLKTLTAGNDTFSGVWEMLGIITNKRFRSVKRGWGKKYLKQIEHKLGIKLIGNEYIEGFQAMDKYFEQHQKEKVPILYFAEDGIVLLTAHQKIISAERLAIIGNHLSKILSKSNITRVITRPFVGKPDNFKRIENKRRDFVTQNYYSPIIKFAGKKINFFTTAHLHRLLNSPKNVKHFTDHSGNHELMEKTNKLLLTKTKKPTLILTCLQDFDSLAHKKEPYAYARKLKKFESQLNKIINIMNRDDLIIITADHGCNPTDNYRYHTRELVPIILYSPTLTKKLWLGKNFTLSSIGQTICRNFSLPPLKYGKAFNKILN